MDNAKIIVNIENIKEEEHKDSFAKCLLIESIGSLGESLLEGIVVLIIKFFVFLLKSIFS